MNEPEVDVDPDDGLEPVRPGDDLDGIRRTRPPKPRRPRMTKAIEVAERRYSR